MIDYAEIEDGIKALLTPLIKTHGVRTLDSYGGEFNESEIISNGGVILVYPAILINIEGFVFDDSVRQAERGYDIRIYCADVHSRGDIPARSGVYGLLKAVRDLINRKNIPGGNNPILLVSEKKEFYSKNLKLCLYSGSYKIKMR